MPARAIRLTGYLDSLDYASAALWSQVNASSPAFVNTSTGELNSADFPAQGTFTYLYTRYSECSTSSAIAKAYIRILNGKIPPRPRTVLICTALSGVININSILGLELSGGVWRYDSNVNPDNTVLNNTVVVTTPSQHAGAIIFDVKTALQQAKNNAAYADFNHRGVVGKKFVFKYEHTSADCFAGTTTLVIVAYD